MLYPLKFRPLYKDYIWGGRNLEKFGKILPEGKVAESWEVSCHPDGPSIISNGVFEGTSLLDIIKKYGKKIIGTGLPVNYIKDFPLLIKMIDANQKPSVQVHPDDEYAQLYENSRYGKAEMWYILSSVPGAKAICGILPGTTKEDFDRGVKNNNIENLLKYIDIFPGDVINVPTGTIHAVGEGITFIEIQQNSNVTYRIFDYNRMDKDGNKRPLHVEKAMDVIDFDQLKSSGKLKGLEVKLGMDSTKTCLVANKHFAAELINISAKLDETADGSRFYIYVMIEGQSELRYDSGRLKMAKGESVLIPADLGNYSCYGNFRALKCYVPDI